MVNGSEQLRKAQKRYKGQYDKKATPVKVNICDRVLVKMEFRRKGKSSCLFEDPYRVVGQGVTRSKFVRSQN